MNTEDRKHILLVEDDLSLGVVLFDQLKFHGYKVNWERNGKDGLKKFHQINPDICVVDLMMPEMDGLTFITKLRENNIHTPVIVSTAKTGLQDKVDSFQSGADDFIPKPFELEELLLRIEARLKNTGTALKQEKTTKREDVSFGAFTLLADSRELKLEGKTYKQISERECEILKLLLDNLGKPVNRGFILECFWGEDNIKNSRSLDVFLSRIRKYLTADPAVNIRNIHGKGYLLEVG